MRSLWIALPAMLSLFSSFTRADTRIDVGVTAGGASDLLQYKGTVPPSMGTGTGTDAAGPGKTRVAATCTDGNGTRFKEGDAGYSSCVTHSSTPRSSNGGLQLGTFGD